MRPPRTSHLTPKSSPSGSWRLNLFVLTVFLMTGVIVFRLFNLTFVRHETLVRAAKSQYENPSALLAGRGNIYFSDLSEGSRGLAATNRNSFYVYSNNKLLNQPLTDVADRLANILQQDQAGVGAKLGQADRTYQVIAVGITKDQAERIKSLKLKGINVASQVDRFYPLGATAGHALGFVGFDGKDRVGQYGLESYYDGTLSGNKKTQTLLGNQTYSRISNFIKFLTFQKNEPLVAQTQTSSQDGSDLILTIDKNIQAMAEAELERVLKKWSAPSGTIIIQDPRSGEILALASSPSFDPNRYFDYNLGDFINPADQEVYEPGSSFKPITMAAAVDGGAVKPETKYNDTGEVVIGGYTVKNFDEKSHGLQSMRQVLEKSLNTGAIFAQNKTGDDPFLNYVVAFGFGQKTGVDLGGEISGNISNLYSGRKINFATAAFGQGIAVTPVQLANAYSAIANGGKLMWPHLVKAIVYPDGSREEIKPKVIGSPIKDATARQMQSMLVDVVDKGFDKARIKGYDVAGKTGTAQIPSPSGGYLTNDQFIHNFVGFAPAYTPRFTVLIKMDRPKGIKFAADSLSPVFGNIARFLIRYFNIPPTRT